MGVQRPLDFVRVFLGQEAIAFQAKGERLYFNAFKRTTKSPAIYCIPTWEGFSPYFGLLHRAGEGILDFLVLCYHGRTLNEVYCVNNIRIELLIHKGTS
jgi:hypothetical protein